MTFEGDSRNRRDDTAMPPERNFGLTFAVVFALIGLIKLPFGGNIRWWAVGVAVVFAAMAFLAPVALRPLNRIWFRFGLILHRIVNPLVLGLLFAIVMVPMALAMRAMGKKFLSLEYDPGAATYWVRREPPGPDPVSIRNQF